MKIRKTAVKAQSPYAERRQPSRLPAGIAAVLSVLSSSAVVIDSEDHVLRASAAARSFGLVKGDRLMVGELLALARQVRRDGEIREAEFEVTTAETAAEALEAGSVVEVEALLERRSSAKK